MRHYISPNTQVVRLSSDDVLGTGLNIRGGGSTSDGDVQSTAMSPRRIYM